MKKLINWFKSSKSDFVLFVIFLVLINLLSFSFYKRIDLTKSKSYSLSKASKELVNNLEQPLSVYSFFDSNLPEAYNAIAQYVEDLLTEYEGAAKKNFNVYKMNTSKPQNAKLADDFGLMQVQIQEVKSKEVGFKQGYMGIAITYGDSVEIINPISSTDGFEYLLSSKISKIISTSDTLAGLPKNDHIELKLYFSDILKNWGISGADEIEKNTRSAYKAVNKRASGRIDFTIENNVSDSVLLDAEKYGLQMVRIQNDDGSITTAVLGLVLIHNDDFYALPVQIENMLFSYAISGIDDLENSITEGLQSLLSNVTYVGYITGHDELALKDDSNSGGMTSAVNFSNLVSEKYQFVEMDLSEEDIPAGMNCIVINGPKSEFLDKELYKIDQFILRGGNVVFFVDGMLENQMAMYYGGESFEKNESNIIKLLEAYGIKIQNDIVFDKNCYTAKNQNYGMLNYYWAPNLQKEQLSQSSVITKNLGYVLMLQNSSIDASAAIEDKNINLSVLAKTSEDSWNASENLYLNPLTMSVPDNKDELHSSVLAVLAEGKFNSYFESAPEFDEPEEKTDKSEVNNKLQTSNHIAKSIANGKLFVTGSSQITTGQVIDEAGNTPVAMLLLNVIDYMNGNQDLCIMRTKGLSANVLTIKSKAAANFWQYFCEFGILVLIFVCWLIVWRIRVNRRKQINKKYNPNDARLIK